MFFRKQRLIIALYAQIAGLRETVARLMGELEATRERAQEMTRIAREAINVAQDKHLASYIHPSQYVADPDPHEVKNCPKCYVALRSEVWPRPCPKCGVWFGDVLDSEVIE